jgi:uncharacterized protein (TIGR02271 family)
LIAIRDSVNFDNSSKVLLKHEEVEVTKKPYVKEEVVVKKKPVTEKRQVSEQVRGERVKTSTGVQEEEQD